MVMVGSGGGGGGGVMSGRAVAAGRGRRRWPQVAGRAADGQRRRRVVRGPRHAAVRVPLVVGPSAAAATPAAPATTDVMARHDGQRQAVLVAVAAGHAEIHGHRAETERSILYVCSSLNGRSVINRIDD